MMAKPILVASSVSSTSPKHIDISSSNRPRRRRQSSSSHRTGPSSGILSILATIAASTASVNGSPAPPPFLCPSFDAEHGSDGTVGCQEPSPTQSLPYSLNPNIQKRSQNPRKGVPDMYAPGDDGVWRRVDSYTLYGSTVCTTCLETANAVTSVSQASSSADSVSSSSSSYDIYDSLPVGWVPIERPHAARTSLILALSLVLAFIICFFIIAYLFWRKVLGRRHKDKDIEMKVRKRNWSTSAGSREAFELKEKEVKVKNKIWARATARWKANARYSARQRRGKRTFISARQSQVNTNDSLVSLEHLGDERKHTNPSPRPSSLQSLPRTLSTQSFIDDPSRSTHASDIPPVEDSQSDAPLYISSNPQSSPPAYRQRIQPLVLDPIPSCSSDSSPIRKILYSPQEDPDLPEPSSSSLYPPLPLQHPFSNSGPSLHAAHVATDDKVTLARLADLASSPPPSEQFTSETSRIEVSVPEWHDEELGDFLDQSPTTQGDASSRAVLPFPAPPSKAVVASTDFYCYPMNFEEMEYLGSNPEPSAPPFEACPSAPSVDDMLLEPSAPPLEETFATPDPEPDSEMNNETEEENVITRDYDRQTINTSSMSDILLQVVGPSGSGSLPVYRP